MFIHYSGTNVHAIGSYNKAQLKMHQSPQEIRGLQPGWNEVPKFIWDQNKDTPSIIQKLEKGELKILPDVIQVKIRGKSGKHSLQKVAVGEGDVKVKITWFKDPKRAIEIVSQTFNRDILQRWEEEETRIKVRKAIKKQLEPLLNNSEDNERPETDSGAEEDFYE